MGLLAALAAFTCWGILPLYWKMLNTVDSFEIMCHRIVWSFVMLLPFMFFRGRLGLLLTCLQNRRNALLLLFTSCLLAGNWWLYIINGSDSYVTRTAPVGFYLNRGIGVANRGSE